jgi:hypothetical protein
MIIDSLYDRLYDSENRIKLFSYSEWWRHIGSVKPRQPLENRSFGTGGKGRCQPERSAIRPIRTIRDFNTDTGMDPSGRSDGFFLSPALF